MRISSVAAGTRPCGVCARELYLASQVFKASCAEHRIPCRVCLFEQPSNYLNCVLDVRRFRRRHIVFRPKAVHLALDRLNDFPDGDIGCLPAKLIASARTGCGDRHAGASKRLERFREVFPGQVADLGQEACCQSLCRRARHKEQH